MKRSLMHRGPILLLLVAVITISAWRIPPTQAQDEQFSPPRIIDLWPVDGVELGRTDSLTITFDQPMDRASVEAAIQITPTVGGTFTWVDAQSLTYDPDGGWPQAAALTLRIDKKARAITGQTLEDAKTYQFTTAGNLIVTSITPKDNSQDVSADTKIIVAFDRPVVPLTTAEETENLPSPISITPEIKGKGSWQNTGLYVFTPIEALPGGSNYTINVVPGLTASDGSPLDAPVKTAFRVALARVEEISFQSDNEVQCPREGKIGLDCPVSVNFTEPMDHQSAEAAFALTLGDQPIAGAFTWSDNGDSFLFKPSQRLKPDRAYTVTIKKTAQNKTRTSELTQTVQAYFQTVPLPKVTRVEPGDGKSVEPGANFYIAFASFMKYSSIQSQLVISPQPNDLVINNYSDYYGFNQDQTSEVYLSFQHENHTTYTITLKAGAEDIYGNRIEKDQSWSFTTTEPKPVPPIAVPILNGTIMSTGYINGKSTIGMLARGKSTANFTVYKLTTEPFNTILSNFQFGGYCHGADGTRGFNGRSLDIEQKDLKPIRTWEQPFTQPDDKISRVDLPLEGIQPGLYLVKMSSKSGSYEFVLAVSTANLTIKRTKDQILVWVTDIATAKPLAKIPVTLYLNPSSYYGAQKVVTQYVMPNTDNNGLTRSDLKLPSTAFFEDEQQLYVIANAKSIYGAWYSCLGYYGGRSPIREGYLYTDRPIYRPGETVYVKGILRSRNDMTYTPLPKKTGKLTLWTYLSYQRQQVSQIDVSINEMGSFSGEFKLPDDVSIGDAFIDLNFPDETEMETYAYNYDIYGSRNRFSVSFQIAAFRPPEFAVNITTPQHEIIQGDPFEFDATASYYSGGLVNDATLDWKTYGLWTSFDYKGKGNYTFDDERWYYFYFSDQDTGSINTGSGTQHVVSSSTVFAGAYGPDDGKGPGAYRTYMPDDPSPGRQPVLLLAEATITDQAQNPVSARSETIIAHPANVYVGIEAQAWGAPIGKPSPIKLIAVRPNSTPLAGQTLNLSISRIEWKLQPHGGDFVGYSESNASWTQVLTEIDKGEIKTASDGTAVYQFTPPNSGIFRVDVQTTDEPGRVASATQRMYVWGTDDVQWNDPLLDMQPTTDKTLYNVGETAEINVPLGFPGKSHVLVTVERYGTLTSDVIEANGPMLTYKLPILDSYAPTAYVYFTAYRGIDATHLQPDYRYGSVKINVVPASRRLNVKVTPSTTNTTPKGKVTFDVLVTDPNGKPTQAEVSLALVDKSVLALTRPNTGTLEETFYPYDVPNYTLTNLSMFGYMPLLTDSYVIPCCFGGGGSPGPLGDLSNSDYVRSNFKFTALWSPFVRTDKDGKATITVTLPDNATTWVLDARVVTVDTLVGQATTELIATLPLLMRPVAPRFFVAGDAVQLAAVINNNSGQDQTAQVSLKATGVTLLDPQTQTVTIPSGKRVRVNWNVKVSDEASNADLVFSVIGQDGYQDAARPLIATGPGGTIPIYQYVTYDSVATAGSLINPGSRTEQINILPRLNTGRGTLDVRFDASLAAATLDTLNYLKGFPYDCNEQTASKLWANLITLKALRKLKVNDPALEKNLDESIQSGFRKLSAGQSSSGYGWGWFPGQPVDPLVTAYVTLTFVEWKELNPDDYRFGNEIRYSIDYLLKQIDTISYVSAADWQLNRQAFFGYVLARVLGTGSETYQPKDRANALQSLRNLYAYRTRLSYAAKSYLLLAFALNKVSTGEIEALAADFESAAITSATMAHWEESTTDWYNWDSDTRTTALVLHALLMAKPNSPLLPNAVRWLMTVRHFDHWETTQETVWSLSALTQWMVKTNELNGNYSFKALLNGISVLNAAVTPDTVRNPQTLQLDVKNLLVGQANRFVVQRGSGDGALYYTANLKMYLPADQVKAINRGVGVTRQYFAANDPNRLLSSAKLGDVITVRLTFTTQQDMRYFVLEDPLPAGTEGIDTSLLTTSISAESPDLTREADRDYYWWWGWWYIDHTEIRDQQVNLFASYLPRGTYTFSYQIRASVAGKFKVMPTHAYPFYYPGVFGRSQGDLFIVEPDKTDLF